MSLDQSFHQGCIQPGVITNPGSGPVERTSLEDAENNIKVLIVDAGFCVEDVIIERNEKEDKNGRYSFWLHKGNESFSVDMPGLPLDEVRYFDSGTQNIWNFPRLYVDGSSWVWMYAVNIVRACLLGEEEDE